MKIISHTDLDGICCAALFLLKFGDRIDIIFASVNDAKDLSEAGVSADYTCDLPKVGSSVNIDHHKSNYDNLINTKRLTEKDWVDPKASSATELVFKFLKFEKNQIAEEIKELGHLADIAELPKEYRILDIVLNMYNDDKLFLRQVSEYLAKYGKKILTISWLEEKHKIIQPIFDETQRIIQQFIDKIKLFPEIVILDVRRAILGKLAKEVFSPIFNQGVAVIALIYAKSKNENIRVSFRVTKEKQNFYDVSVVAKTFGGGGHRMAAACSPKRDFFIIKLKKELEKIAQPNDDIEYFRI